MSKLTQGLALVVTVALSLGIGSPARADIDDLIGNTEDIQAIDLTDLATGRISPLPLPKSGRATLPTKNKSIVVKKAPPARDKRDRILSQKLATPKIATITDNDFNPPFEFPIFTDR
jgi:hypothetical protein